MFLLSRAVNLLCSVNEMPCKCVVSCTGSKIRDYGQKRSGEGNNGFIQTMRMPLLRRRGKGLNLGGLRLKDRINKGHHHLSERKPAAKFHEDLGEGSARARKGPNRDDWRVKRRSPATN